MLKDIFIDNNIAKNFGNPQDPEYKKLQKWLMDNETEPKSYLVVSNKLLAEYYRSVGQSYYQNSIPSIIDKLTREGRLIKISNEQIKEFKRQYFTNKVKKNFTCNKEDQEHIPVVLLSDRKYVLTLDQKFTDDLLNFPGFRVIVCAKPQDFPYDK
jgi:predicted nucleic acid-binding protein